MSESLSCVSCVSWLKSEFSLAIWLRLGRAVRGQELPEPKMGKNGTFWDVFEGFQSHLAMYGGKTPRGSAARWVLVGSC